MPNPQMAPPWRKLLSANTTNAAAFATPAALTYTPSTGGWATLPAGAAVIDTQLLARQVWLRFFGTDAENEVAQVRISPLRVSGTATTALFVPTPLVGYTITLGARQGDANTNAGAADFYADELARLSTLGVDNVTDTVVSAAGLVIPASLMFDARTARFHLIELRVTSAASINAEWTPVNN